MFEKVLADGRRSILAAASDLKQDKLSVAEYGLRFTQLSVYAANLITTEEEKCLRFEEGLHYDIRSKLTPYDMENFSRLMAAAVRAEKLVKERKAYLASQKESGSRSEKRKDPSTAISGNGKRSKNDESQKGGTGLSSQPSQSQKSNSNQQPKCPTCRRYHFGECRMKKGGCYKCGELGHHIRDCPKRQNTGETGSEPTV